MFFATIAVVVFGAVAIATPKTAAQLEGRARWDLLLRAANAIWLLPLAWSAWTIATTGTIRSRNLVGTPKPTSGSTTCAAGDERKARRLASYLAFRQRIVFRTEDPATIEGGAKLSGSIEVTRVSESRGRSRSSRGFESTSTQSGGSSLSWHRQQVVDPQLFWGLRADQLLSIGRESYDDVLEMPPVYVDERSRL